MSEGNKDLEEHTNLTINIYVTNVELDIEIESFRPKGRMGIIIHSVLGDLGKAEKPRLGGDKMTRTGSRWRPKFP